MYKKLGIVETITKTIWTSSGNELMQFRIVRWSDARENAPTFYGVEEYNYTAGTWDELDEYDTVDDAKRYIDRRALNTQLEVDEIRYNVQ